MTKTRVSRVVMRQVRDTRSSSTYPGQHARSPVFVLPAPQVQSRHCVCRLYSDLQYPNRCKREIFLVNIAVPLWVGAFSCRAM